MRHTSNSPPRPTAKDLQADRWASFGIGVLGVTSVLCALGLLVAMVLAPTAKVTACELTRAELTAVDNLIVQDRQRVEAAGGGAMTLSHEAWLKNIRRNLESEKAQACR